MATLEQGFDIGIVSQESTNKRTLTPPAAQRIILRLTSCSPEALSYDDAPRFSHVLRNTKQGKRDYALTYRKHSYYVDFNAVAAEENRSALHEAVGRIDTALFETGLPAAIVQAWAVAENSPQVSQLYPEDWKAMEANSIIETALETFERHNEEMLGPIVERMLFDPNFA